MLQEEEITPKLLLSKIEALYENRQTYIAAMETSNASNAIETIISLIEEQLQSK